MNLLAALRREAVVPRNKLTMKLLYRNRQGVVPNPATLTVQARLRKNLLVAITLRAARLAVRHPILIIGVVKTRPNGLPVALTAATQAKPLAATSHQQRHLVARHPT